MEKSFKLWIAGWAVAVAVAIPAAYIGIHTIQSSVARHGMEQDKEKLSWLAAALHQYTQDFGGDLPDSFPTLLAREAVRPDAFISALSKLTPVDGPTTQAAADNLAAGGHCSFTYLGKGLTTKTVAANDVTVYEPISANDVQMLALTADAGVHALNSDQAAAVNEQITRGVSPVTLPTVASKN